MQNNTFMDKIRIFLGIRQEPPRNDFRNPIWDSDDEDDDNELFARQHINIYTDPSELHQEFANQMQDMFSTFGNMIGDMKSFFKADFEDVGTNTNTFEYESSDAENSHGGSIRDYYLKPGFNEKKDELKEDVDLDGKISSHEISGLLKQKGDSQKNSGHIPFNGKMVPGRSFCQTIITTSVKKPDGTVETRRIVKNGHDIVEETTTSSQRDDLGPISSNIDSMSPMITNSGIIYSNVMSELSSLFKNFY